MLTCPKCKTKVRDLMPSGKCGLCRVKEIRRKHGLEVGDE